MDPHVLMIAWIVIYLFAVILLDKKYLLLRDSSTAENKPYSLSRVQLAWWMGFVLCAFIAVVFNKYNTDMNIPTFSDGILVVLGISSITTAAATLTDVSDQSNSLLTRHQNDEGGGKHFFIDILSDQNGVSVHRLQTVLFNLIFAVWFFLKVWKNLDFFHDAYKGYLADANPVLDAAKAVQARALHLKALNDSFAAIIPNFNQNALVLLGLSSGTYIAIKTTENKGTADKTADATTAAPNATPENEIPPVA